MDKSLPVLFGLGVLGYICNKEDMSKKKKKKKINIEKFNSYNKNENKNQNENENISEKIIKEQFKNENNIESFNNNIYESEYSNFIKLENKNKCINRYNDSKLFEETNIIPKNMQVIKKHSELTDSEMDFAHNNMVPFYGGRIKQNMDLDSHNTRLNNYTGMNDLKPKKDSTLQLFKPVKDLSHVNGTPIVNNRDRYNAGKYKTNESPIESIRVGPGLGLNPNDGPTGGFHQDIRDFTTPKNVDELRVKTNPKISYEGRVVQGKSVTDERTSVPNFTQVKQRNFAINKEQFANSGVSKPKAKPTHILKNTNRKDSIEIIGTAGNNKSNLKPELRSNYKRSNKITLTINNNRNMKLKSKSNNNNNQNSYRAGGYNKHSNIENKDSFRNVLNAIKKRIMPFFDKSNTTIKQTTINNPYNSNVDSNKKIVSKPKQKFRVTTKQTTIDNEHTGFLDGEDKPTTRFTDKASTTIKETTLNEKFGPMSVPLSVSKTKEYTKDNLKTTIKETTLDSGDNKHRNLNGNDKHTKQLSDKAKTTHKETYVDNEYYGDAGQNKKEDGYLVANFEAKETKKEQTSDNDYYGGVSEEQQNGYLVSNFEAPETCRQHTSDNDYYGTMGGEDKTMSYDNIYNMTLNELKEEISKGRTPTNSSTKSSINSDDINVQVNKKNEYENKKRNNFTKIVNAIPDKSTMCITNENDNSLIDAIMEQQQNRNNASIIKKQLSDNPLVI